MQNPSNRWRRTASLSALALSLIASTATAADRTTSAQRDEFYWLGEFNKASLVMVVERGIVPRPLGTKIADAVAKVIDNGELPGAKRPADYLQLEPLITAIAGPDATRMHSGRSRQDIIPTTLRVMQRDRLLELSAKLDEVRGKLLALAARNTDTIVPAYTNGVQAQPTTYAHYLLGFTAVFDRDAERLRQAYARLNLSPLGAAALGTSSFPVDRPRLADLLGFDGVDENSYDAAQLAPMDTGTELVSIAASIAQITGAFVEDIHTQYHETQPWIMLREGRLTGPSSIMPQKRNPYGLNVTRLQASDVVGDAVTYLFESHNVTPGMPDYKRTDPSRTLDATTDMLTKLSALVDGLVIDPARSLAEVDADYSTTTELADTLQREADVPFRLGHHFASELVTFGRSHHLKPADIPYGEAQRIYAEAAHGESIAETLPLSELQFHQTLNARNMVTVAKGLGGPQPVEVARMLAAGKGRLDQDIAWRTGRSESLLAAQKRLNAAFTALRNPT